MSVCQVATRLMRRHSLWLPPVCLSSPPSTGHATCYTWSSCHGNRSDLHQMSDSIFARRISTSSYSKSVNYISKSLPDDFLNVGTPPLLLCSAHRSTSHHVQAVRLSGVPTQSLLGDRLSGKGRNSHWRQFSLSTKSILESSPSSIQPYLRLIRFDKPIGTYLLFWPCSWSIAMAADAGHLPSLYYLAMFGAGAFFMRGAGCIINDMWDRDIDRKVDRTRSRPLASGELTHFQALTFLSTQLGLSLAILLQFNTYSILLGAASIGLVVAYPLAKRYTYWPQLMLGVTLNWGVLLSWAAMHGSVTTPVLSMYLACALYTVFYDTIYSHQIMLQMQFSSAVQMSSYAICTGITFNYGVLLGWAAVKDFSDWSVLSPMYAGALAWTLIYDTIYAHQDKYDDMLIGVKSTALKLGDQTKPWLSCFSTIVVGGLSLSGYMCDQTWPFYVGVAATAAHLAHQLYTVDLNNPEDCAGKFRSNTQIGVLMFLAIACGTLLKKSSEKDKEPKTE